MILHQSIYSLQNNKQAQARQERGEQLQPTQKLAQEKVNGRRRGVGVSNPETADELFPNVFYQLFFDTLGSTEKRSCSLLYCNSNIYLGVGG